MGEVRGTVRSATVVAVLVVAVAAGPLVGEAHSLCDANLDGVISVSDGVNVLRAAAQLPSLCNLAACDADGDGAITVADGVNVLRAAASLASACDHEACVDIAGQWHVSETADITCTVDGESESESQTGEGIISIRQEGCNISYVVPGFDVARSGTVTRNYVHMSGPFVVAGNGNVYFTKNIATVDGAANGDGIMLSGEGIAEGTADGSSFRCTGQSTAVFSRFLAGSPHPAEARGIRRDPALVLGGSVQRFTIVGW